MGLLGCAAREGSILGGAVMNRISNTISESNNVALENYFEERRVGGVDYPRFAVSSRDELETLAVELHNHGIDCNFIDAPVGRNGQYVCEIPDMDINGQSSIDILKTIVSNHDITVGEYQPSKTDESTSMSGFGTSLVNTMVVDHLDTLGTAVHYAENLLSEGRNLADKLHGNDKYGTFSNTEIFNSRPDQDGLINPTLDAGKSNVARVINGNTVIINGQVIDPNEHAAVYNDVIKQYNERERMADKILAGSDAAKASEKAAVNFLNEQRDIVDDFDRISKPTLEQQRAYDNAMSILESAKNDLGLDIDKKIKAKDLKEMNAALIEKAEQAGYDIKNSIGGIDEKKLAALTDSDWQKIGVDDATKSLITSYNSNTSGLKTIQEMNAVAIKNKLYDQEFAVNVGDKTINIIKDEPASFMFWSMGALDETAKAINEQESTLAALRTEVAFAKSFDAQAELAKKAAQVSTLDALKASGLTKGLNIGSAVSAEDIVNINKNFIDAMSSINVSVVDKWGRFDKNVFNRMTKSQFDEAKKLGYDLRNKAVQEHFLKSLDTATYGNVGFNTDFKKAFSFGAAGFGFIFKNAAKYGDQSSQEGYADIQQLIQSVSSGAKYTKNAVKSIHKVNAQVRTKRSIQAAKRGSKTVADLKQNMQNIKQARNAQSITAKEANDKLKLSMVKKAEKAQKMTSSQAAKAAQKVKNVANVAGKKLSGSAVVKAGAKAADVFAKAMTAVSDAASAVLLPILKIVAIVVAVVAAAAAKLYIVINVVMALLCAVQGIFNWGNIFVPKYQRTIAYNLYEKLTEQETILYRDVTQAYANGRTSAPYMTYGFFEDNPIEYAFWIDGLEFTSQSYWDPGSSKYYEFDNTSGPYSIKGTGINNTHQLTGYRRTLLEVDPDDPENSIGTGRLSNEEYYNKFSRMEIDAAPWNFYPNPFSKDNFVDAAHNQQYLTRTNPNKFTGLVGYNITTNMNAYNIISDPSDNMSAPPTTVDNGHTSNIRDIISMVDIMYQMEAQDGNDDNMQSILGKTPSQYEAEYFFGVLKNTVKAMFNTAKTWLNNVVHLKDTWGVKDAWVIEPIKVDGVSYKTIQKYAMTLFEASHQQSTYLSVVYGNYNASMYNELGNKIKFEGANGNAINAIKGVPSIDSTICDLYKNYNDDNNPETSMEYGICTSPTVTKFPVKFDTTSGSRKVEPYIKKAEVYGSSLYNGEEKFLNTGYFDVKVSSDDNAIDRNYGTWKSNSTYCIWTDMPKVTDVVSFREASTSTADGLTSILGACDIDGKLSFPYTSTSSTWYNRVESNAKNSKLQCWKSLGTPDVIKISKEMPTDDYEGSLEGNIRLEANRTDPEETGDDYYVGWAIRLEKVSEFGKNDLYTVCGDDYFKDRGFPEGYAAHLDFNLSPSVEMIPETIKTHTTGGKTWHSGKGIYTYCTIKRTQYKRACTGHEYAYCGGHISITTNLNVFSMTNEQLGMSGTYDNGAEPLALYDANLLAATPYSTALLNTWDINARNAILKEVDGKMEDVSAFATRYPKILGKIRDSEVDYSTFDTAIKTGGGITAPIDIYQGTLVSPGLNMIKTGTTSLLTEVKNLIVEDLCPEWAAGIFVQEKPFSVGPAQATCPQCGTPYPNAYDATTYIPSYQCANCGKFYSIIGVSADPELVAPPKYKLTAENMTALNQCRDIFDVDCVIKKGDNIFNCRDYTDYAGWTETNMEMAINRFTIDWFDVYGFDISQELGNTNMRLSKKDIYIMMYGLLVQNGLQEGRDYTVAKDGVITLTPTCPPQYHAIQAALFNVGRGYCSFPNNNTANQLYDSSKNKWSKNKPNYLSFTSEGSTYVETVQLTGLGTIDSATMAQSKFRASSTAGTMADFYEYLVRYADAVTTGRVSPYFNTSYVLAQNPRTLTSTYSSTALQPGDFVIHQGYDAKAAGKFDTQLYGAQAVDGRVLKDFYCSDQALLYVGTYTPATLAKMREFYARYFYSEGDGSEVDYNTTATTAEAQRNETITKQREFLDGIFPPDYSGFKLSYFREAAEIIPVNMPIFIDFNRISAFSSITLRYKSANTTIGNWHDSSVNTLNYPEYFLDVANKKNMGKKFDEYALRGDAAYTYYYPWLKKAIDGSPDNRTRIIKGKYTTSSAILA